MMMNWKRTTARQSCCASLSAVVRSLPVQLFWIQAVAVEMKVESLQRQVSSVGLQLPVEVVARQLAAQSDLN